MRLRTDLLIARSQHAHVQPAQISRIPAQAGIELAKRAIALKPGLKVVYSTGLTLTDGVRALLVPGGGSS